MLPRVEAIGRSPSDPSMTRMRGVATATTGCQRRRRSASRPWKNWCYKPMDLNQDWREWLESLNANRVEYIIVGGIALAIHGFPRATGDLDVLVHPTRDNAAAVVAALCAFGFSSLNISVEDLSAEGRVIQLGFPPRRIDVLTSIDGVPWIDARAHALSTSLDGIPVLVISREDLAANKRAVGRPQDLADAVKLEAP